MLKARQDNDCISVVETTSGKIVSEWETQAEAEAFIAGLRFGMDTAQEQSMSDGQTANKVSF